MARKKSKQRFPSQKRFKPKQLPKASQEDVLEIKEAQRVFKELKNEFEQL